jgi:hypothetical protein
MPEVTIADLRVLNHHLVRLSTTSHLRVAHCLGRNRDTVERELKIAQETIKETEAMKAFTKEREGLAAKYAEKDSGGNPLKDFRNTPRGPVAHYRVTDLTALEAAVEALKVQHPQAAKDGDEYDQKLIELESLTVNFEPYTIQVENTKKPGSEDESILDAEAMFILHRCGILIP